MKKYLFKFLLLSLFLSLLHTTHAQESLSGTYREATVKGHSGGNEQYIFMPDGTFRYEFATDVMSNNKWGEGQYRLEEKQLILNFTKAQMKKPGFTYAESENIPEKLSLTVFSKADSAKLAGVTIELLDESKQPIAGASTNLKGQANFAKPALQDARFVKFSYMGMQDALFDLKETLIEDLQLYMVNNYGEEIEAGRQFKLKVKKSGYDLLIKNDRKYKRFIKI